MKMQVAALGHPDKKGAQFQGVRRSFSECSLCADFGRDGLRANRPNDTRTETQQSIGSQK
jgi:hypothetical protein